MEKLEDLGSNIGVGLGFTFMGIFILNIYHFFGVPPIAILQWIGIAISIAGVAGMLTSLGKKDGADFLSDIGAAMIIFAPSILIFIFSPVLWLKVLFAFFTSFSLVFVGMAAGRTLFKKDGSMRINLKTVPRLSVVLLTTIAACLSALSSLTGNNLLQTIFHSYRF